MGGRAGGGGGAGGLPSGAGGMPKSLAETGTRLVNGETYTLLADRSGEVITTHRGMGAGGHTTTSTTVPAGSKIKYENKWGKDTFKVVGKKDTEISPGIAARKILGK